ncbi:Uncharacterised protein [uncultured archaeon]|nr:Uncharacterised protein [uncultured archaeon]
METVHAIYEGKTFRLKHPLDLKPGQEVELIIREIPPIETDPSFDLASLAVDTGVSDLAVEHDHYLYGISKRGPKNVK